METSVDKELVNQLITDFNEIFIDKNVNIVEMLKIGFISTDTTVPVISMIIHCIENIEIFDNKRLHKLSKIIKKYKDG